MHRLADGSVYTAPEEAGRSRLPIYSAAEGAW